jgi:3D (Asp-Asp-Asp) domain-containing protein
MQRHLLPVLILALAVALPARASHHKTHSTAKTKAAAPVAVVPATPIAPTPTRLAGSKGARLVAQTPVVASLGTKIKKAKPASVKVAAKPAPAALPVTVQPTLMGRLARLTAYWTSEDYWTSKHMSSTGVKLHEGVCAVDPKLIPYGSVVQIPGMRSYVAVDTGSAVISRQAAIGASHTTTQRDALVIDLFFENEHEAQQFAAHGPTYVAVSWTKPLTSVDAPKNPLALPAVPVPAPRPTPVYVLASAPPMGNASMSLAFRSPQM